MIHLKINEEFLNNFIEEFNKIEFKNLKLCDLSEIHCSDKVLFDRMNNPDSYERHNNSGEIIFLERYPQLNKYINKFKFYLYKNHKDCSIINSGFFYYPQKSYMGWHTNADDPYLRCYITYSKNGDSYFKYYDQNTKKTVTTYDYTGWNIRYFKVSNKINELFWHCVYSNTDRISIGFQIIKNLKNIDI